jgi:hypothetical protein
MGGLDSYSAGTAVDGQILHVLVGAGLVSCRLTVVTVSALTTTPFTVETRNPQDEAVTE